MILLGEGEFLIILGGELLNTTEFKTNLFGEEIVLEIWRFLTGEEDKVTFCFKGDNGAKTFIEGKAVAVTMFFSIIEVERFFSFLITDMLFSFSG